jgi:hypothetical protein
MLSKQLKQLKERLCYQMYDALLFFVVDNYFNDSIVIDEFLREANSSARESSHSCSKPGIGTLDSIGELLYD